MAHMTPTPVLEPGQDRTMSLNMGPQHPSTHGVLRVLLEIDGETVVRLMPDIGYLHTGIEKTCEAKFYQQVVGGWSLDGNNFIFIRADRDSRADNRIR